MTTVDKLLIQGIRSFSPTNTQLIEFYRPLTIIVGENGAGKTTIIECLKYASTGDLPPNSQKGQTFVHDTKVAGAREVKAQIKMRFRNINGLPIVCTRSLQLTQKGASLSLKTLDSSLQTYNKKKEKVSQSYRCGDIDKEIPLLMGVSKPILQHVIFCHQEESNWPLAEASQLKKKFDDIFAATRYTKALETIRKLKKEQDHVVRECRLKLENLATHRDHARGKRKQLADAKGKVAKLHEAMTSLAEEIENCRSELASIQTEVSTFKDALLGVKELQAVKAQMESEAGQLLDAITQEYDESNEDLMFLLSNFDDHLADHKCSEIRWKQSLQDLGDEKNVMDREANELASSLGGLEASLRSTNSAVRERDAAIAEFCARLEEHSDLSAAQTELLQAAVSPSPRFVSDAAVASALAVGFELLERTDERLSAASDAQDAMTEAIATNVVERRKALTTAEQRIIALRQSVSDNDEALAELQRKVEQSKDFQSKLAATKSAQAEAEVQLENLQKSSPLEDMLAEQSSLIERLEASEKEVQELNEALQVLMRESGRRANLDLTRKQLDELNRKYDELKAKLTPALATATDVSIDSKSPEIQSYILAQTNARSTEKRRLSEQLSDTQRIHSAEEGTLQHVRQRLETETARLEALRAQVRAVVPTNYKHTYADLLRAMDQKLDAVENRVRKMEHDSRMFSDYSKVAHDDEECPLCYRKFENEEKLQTFLSDLTGLVDESKLEARKGKADHLRAQLQRVKEVEPAWLELQQLEVSVPTSEDEVRQRVLRVAGLAKTVAGLQETLRECTTCEEGMRSLLELANQMTAVHSSIEDLVAQSRFLAEELGVDTDARSADDINAQLSEANERRKTFRSLLDVCRQNVTAVRENLSLKESAVYKLREESMKIMHAGGEISNLESSIVKLREQTDVKQRELRLALDEEKDATSALDEALAEEQSVKEKKSDVLSGLTREKAQVAELVSTLEGIASRVSLETMREIETRTDAVRIQRKNAEARSAELEAQMRETLSELKDVQEKLAMSDVIRRNISDNVQYRKVLANIAKTQNTIDEKRRTMLGSGHDLESMELAAGQAHRRIERKNNKLNQKKGMHTTFQRQVRGFEDELKQPKYQNVDKDYTNMLIDVKTTEMANADLDKYYKALEKALTTFHSSKMEEINKIIKELWQTTYRGADIDAIEIRADTEPSTTGSARRVKFNYRVVMIKGDTELDMRGRCSAGQKVLASLVIRLALAETFCLNCGILALDEPTTNLDRRNVDSLAKALTSIISARRRQANFQLIVITHDEEFVQRLGRTEHADYYWRITKDVGGHSDIKRQDIRDLA